MTNVFYVMSDFDGELLEGLPKLYEMIEDQADKRDPRVNVIINSYGGFTDVLKAFMDAFEYGKNEGVTVATYVSGFAGSCASLLAVSGSKGYRFVSEHSQHYLHLGAGWSLTAKSVEESRRIFESNRNHFEFVKGTYERLAKVPDIAEKLRDDHLFVDAKTSVKWGLADKVGGLNW